MVNLGTIFNQIDEAKEKGRRYVCGDGECSRATYFSIKEKIREEGFFSAKVILELRSAIFSRSIYWMTYEIDLEDIAHTKKYTKKLIKKARKNNDYYNFSISLEPKSEVNDWFFFTIRKELEKEGYTLRYTCTQKRKYWVFCNGIDIHVEILKNKEK